MASMAVAARKLDVNSGDLVEIDGRRYDVVPGKLGGATLEPTITVFADELRERHGARPLTDEEFEELPGDLPPTARAGPWLPRAAPRIPTPRC